MPPIRWQTLSAIVLLSILSTHEIKASHNLPVAANGWRPIIGDRYEKRGQVQDASHNVPQVVENTIPAQNKQPTRTKNNPSSNRPENYQTSLNNHQFRPENSGGSLNHPNRQENFQGNHYFQPENVANRPENSNHQQFRPENQGNNPKRPESLGTISNNNHFRPENAGIRPESPNNQQFRLENQGNRPETLGTLSNNHHFRPENTGSHPKRPENTGSRPENLGSSSNNQFRTENVPKRSESLGAGHHHVRQESSSSNGHQSAQNVKSLGNLQYLGDGGKGNKHHLQENRPNRPKETLKGQESHNSFVKTSPGHIRVNHHGSTGHHSKHHKPVHAPSKSHSRHPSPPIGKMPPGAQNKRPPNKGKQPSRTQATAHSQRDEIIAPAPSSAIGSYTYFNQGPFNIRDTQLGDRNKPYHHEFRPHYNLQASNSDLLPHIHHPHYFAKHPSQNELQTAHFNQYYNQNDEFTRNLVPPLPSKHLVDKEKEEKQQLLLTNSKQYLLPKPNVLLQLPSYNYDERPVGLEITKERLKEYHTTAAPPIFSRGTTEGYSTLKYSNKPITYNHGYEVTEDKNWQENSPFFQAFRPTTPLRQQTYPTIVPELANDYRETTQFLPTPFIENIYPTVPSQEISTIYSEIAKLNRQNYQSNRYNIKEVATHFPIYDIQKPVVTIQEVTTKKEIPEVQTEEYIPPTQEPIRTTTKAQRPRQNVRRRRPTKPTTTTEIYEPETERYIVTSEKPRRRRPIKQRTTESNFDETTRGTRRKPTTQSIEEESENYPPNFPVKTVVTENYPQIVEDKKIEESVQSYQIESEPTTELSKPTALQYSDEPYFETTTIKRKRLRTTTEEPQQFTNIKFPENELDYTTLPPFIPEIITEQVKEPEITTILTTTSTTTTEPTTKSNRIRRPSKYDTHRPRFSVKDYKQRLTQYVSTTTETNKVTTATNIGRIKYPSRFTKTPTSKEEDDTEMLRFRFKPKEPRHKSSTEQYIPEPTTEKQKINRVRPFNRRTTEATTTTAPKVSIKPNIFSNLRRPQAVSLRNKILNKNKNAATTELPTTTEVATEKTEVTIQMADNDMESTTESFRRILENTSQDYEDKSEGEEMVDDAEAFLQLQRITELTSQAKNNPTYFKTMSSPSRKVPNYFTISTDDPILPIEAFFPKLNRNDNKNEE